MSQETRAPDWLSHWYQAQIADLWHVPVDDVTVTSWKPGDGVRATVTVHQPVHRVTFTIQECEPEPDATEPPPSAPPRDAP